MTKQPDWKAEREAIRARLEAVAKGNWRDFADGYRGHEIQANAPFRSVGYVSAATDADLIAHAPEDLRRLLAHAKEDELLIAGLTEALEDRACRETEMLEECERFWKAELALRDQRISELEEMLEDMVAHPKFESDGNGGIRYYLTQRDVENARSFLEAAKNSKIETKGRH